jgi:putative thioredoxin
MAALRTKAEKGASADRFKLARALFAHGEFEEAIDALLEIIRKDREWQQGKAKGFLVEIFEALGPTNPLVARGKRRLSSVLFS